MRVFDAGNYTEYLRDESGCQGKADKIYFVSCESEVEELLGQQVGWTVQGARTGISGCCVPEGGNILNMSEFDGFCGMREDGQFFYLRVKAGTTLTKLEHAVRTKKIDCKGWDQVSSAAYERFRKAGEWMFAPAPTEKNATLGGMFALAAAGPAAACFGSMSGYVTGIKMADMAGELHWITDGRKIQELSGTGGTEGVFLELELKLIPRPAAIWTLLVFFPDDESALEFAEQSATENGGVYLTALDYIDTAALAGYREYARTHESLRDIPTPPEGACMLYIQVASDREEELEDFLGELLEIFSSFRVRDEDIWAADGYEEQDKFERLRHGVTEALLCPDLMDAMLLDLSVADGTVSEFLAEEMNREETVKNVSGVIAHIPGRVLHVRVRKVEAAILSLMRAALAKGGGIGIENGVGKLKKYYLDMAVDAISQNTACGE